MPEAERMHSMPPTNTPTSRRRFLSAAATLAADGTALALAAIPPALAANAQCSAAIDDATDPAFAVIAEKRAADIAHDRAIDAQGEFDGRGDFRSPAAIEARDNCGDACGVVNEADWRLATTPPTTLAGVAAVLRFANEIEDGGNEWPDTDAIGPDGWHYQLRATMAAAIEALIEAPAGNAVQS